MFCKTCGSSLSEDAQFCKGCGVAVEASSAASAPPSYGAPTAGAKKPGNRKLIWGIAIAAVALIAVAAALGGYYGTRSHDDPGGAQTGDGLNVDATNGAGEDDTGLTSGGETNPDGGTATHTTVKPDPLAGGTLRVLIAGDPFGIDPLRVTESTGWQVADALFDSLTKFDYKTGELLPAAADAWEADAEATVWTFHLVEGARFHDGTPVTAADFKYAWERLCNPVNESPSSYLLAPIKGYENMRNGTATDLAGVEIIDEHTLQVTLSHSFSDFEYLAGHVALAPVPKSAVQTAPQAFAEQPVGNGPFMMTEPWVHNELISVVRNDGYYTDRAHLDGVDFVIFTEFDNVWTEFQAGHLDFGPVWVDNLATASATYGLSPDGMTVAAGEQVLTGPEASVMYISLNTANEVLADPQVRQALSLAIDREAISQAVFLGQRIPASNIVPPGIAGREEAAWEHAKFDRAAAKATLAAAGYANGRGLPAITLDFSPEYQPEKIASMVKADWEAIGADVTLEPIPTYGELLEKHAAGNFMAGLDGWIADYPTIDCFVTPLFFSESAENFSSFDVQAVDDAIETARATVDSTERIARYQALVETIGEASPVIPLLYTAHMHIGSDRVHDLVYSAMGQLSLEDAWVTLQPDGGGD